MGPPCSASASLPRRSLPGQQALAARQGSKQYRREGPKQCCIPAGPQGRLSCAHPWPLLCRPPRAGILNVFGGVLTFKRKAEEALEASGMPYVIVRPGGWRRRPARAACNFAAGCQWAAQGIIRVTQLPMRPCTAFTSTGPTCC